MVSVSVQPRGYLQSPSVVFGREEKVRYIGTMIGHWEELEETESRNEGGFLEVEKCKIRSRSSQKLDELRRIFEGGELEANIGNSYPGGKGGTDVNQEGAELHRKIQV